jgi:hypothetical protein
MCDDSTAFEGPYLRNREFQRISVRIAEIDRRRISAKSEFALDGYALSEQPLAPRWKFVRLDSKRHMSCAGGTVGRQSPILSRNIRAEQKEHARSGTDLERSSASSGKVSIGDLAKAQNIPIKGKRAIQI